MKLTGKVVKLEAGSEFNDKHDRVYIRVKEGGGSMYNTFCVPNDVNELTLDSEVEIVISTVKQLSRAAS